MYKYIIEYVCDTKLPRMVFGVRGRMGSEFWSVQSQKQILKCNSMHLKQIISC